MQDSENSDKEDIAESKTFDKENVDSGGEKGTDDPTEASGNDEEKSCNCQEDCGEDCTCKEKDASESLTFKEKASILAVTLIDYNDDEFKAFTLKKIEDLKYDIMEVIANEKIAWRQLIDPKSVNFGKGADATYIENLMDNTIQCFERNKKVLEIQNDKLAKEFKEVVYMDQAEVTSIRTIKD